MTSRTSSGTFPPNTCGCAGSRAASDGRGRHVVEILSARSMSSHDAATSRTRFGSRRRAKASMRTRVLLGETSRGRFGEAEARRVKGRSRMARSAAESAERRRRVIPCTLHRCGRDTRRLQRSAWTMMDRGDARVVRASTGDVVMTSVDEDADAGERTRASERRRDGCLHRTRRRLVDVQSECIGGNIVVARRRGRDDPSRVGLGERTVGVAGEKVGLGDAFRARRRGVS